jgi:hypothetical protein
MIQIALGSRGTRNCLLIALLAGYVTLALGDEPAQPAAPKKRAVAFGYAGSTVGVDVPRAGDDSLTPGGLGALGRFDLHGGWGLQLGYSRKDDRLERAERSPWPSRACTRTTPGSAWTSPFGCGSIPRSACHLRISRRPLR